MILIFSSSWSWCSSVRFAMSGTRSCCITCEANKKRRDFSRLSFSPFYVIDQISQEMIMPMITPANSQIITVVA
jgi:hypothetical protein